MALRASRRLHAPKDGPRATQKKPRHGQLRRVPEEPENGIKAVPIHFPARRLVLPVVTRVALEAPAALRTPAGGAARSLWACGGAAFCSFLVSAALRQTFLPRAPPPDTMATRARGVARLDERWLYQLLQLSSCARVRSVRNDVVRSIATFKRGHKKYNEYVESCARWAMRCCCRQSCTESKPIERRKDKCPHVYGTAMTSRKTAGKPREEDAAKPARSHSRLVFARLRPRLMHPFMVTRARRAALRTANKPSLRQRGRARPRAAERRGESPRLNLNARARSPSK